MPSRKRGKGGDKFGFSKRGLKAPQRPQSQPTPREEMRAQDDAMQQRQVEILRRAESLVLASFSSSLHTILGPGRLDEKAVEKLLFDCTDAATVVARNLWGAELHSQRRPDEPQKTDTVAETAGKDQEGSPGVDGDQDSI